MLPYEIWADVNETVPILQPTPGSTRHDRVRRGTALAVSAHGATGLLDTGLSMRSGDRVFSGVFGNCQTSQRSATIFGVFDYVSTLMINFMLWIGQERTNFTL